MGPVHLTKRNAYYTNEQQDHQVVGRHIVAPLLAALQGGEMPLPPEAETLGHDVAEEGP